ncbi:glycosyltransferase family A protein [Sphaerisporangium melleum]|uniref:4,4'-diaponeurosporenoate glycosyltransferase n=1 Tax=Sphaerisporangium melleum TaxID=321316 RepID=A0A917VPD0_9ACTN|nr:glycosyltransferase [Sphaerisporangium melleum]GGL00788.1 glycosyl transferase [Sphaerisporangium melleum]
MDLWVIVPAYNEVKGIEATLRALEEQDDRDFTLLVVDNASTDGTAEAVRAYAAASSLTVHLVQEEHKGTGAASDTGMRHAIAQGATHLARTDADCLPRRDWVRAIRRAFGDGLEMVGGKLRPRNDEFRLKLWERRLIPFVVEVAAAFGRLRPGNRDDAYLGPYVMMPGATVALTASLYERSGGFPRTAIEEVHEDRALVNRVRKVTAAYASRRDVVVYGSVRRLRAYGLAGTLAWYADHHYRPEVVDVR